MGSVLPVCEVSFTSGRTLKLGCVRSPRASNPAHALAITYYDPGACSHRLQLPPRISTLSHAERLLRTSSRKNDGKAISA
jgi:hypothetical protein